MWVDANLTDILNSHTKPLRVTAHSKWWLTPEVVAKPKNYGQIWQLYQQRRASMFTLKVAVYFYYYTAQ